MFSAFGPGTTWTNSHPSWPHVSKICFVAWINSGTVAYSHFVMSRSVTARPRNVTGAVNRVAR